MNELTVEDFTRSKVKEAISGFTHKQKVIFAVYCAELVIDIYENKNDGKAPRLAIEAAKEWIKSPTEENKQKCKDADAAYAAAAADADAAAYAAYAAADAADAAADADAAAYADAAADADAAAAYDAYAAADAADAAADADAAAAAADAAYAKNKIRQKIIDKVNEIKSESNKPIEQLTKITSFGAIDDINTKVLSERVGPSMFDMEVKQFTELKELKDNLDRAWAVEANRPYIQGIIDQLSNKEGE
jgi:hypothetical protein